MLEKWIRIGNVLTVPKNLAGAQKTKSNTGEPAIGMTLIGGEGSTTWGLLARFETEDKRDKAFEALSELLVEDRH